MDVGNGLFRRVPATAVESPQHWLMVSDICELAKLPKSTVKLMISDGRLPGYRPPGSRSVRVKVEDYNRLFRQIVPKPKTRAGQEE
jgi:excisionase family DNA binding protein